MTCVCGLYKHAHGLRWLFSSDGVGRFVKKWLKPLRNNFNDSFTDIGM